ncbi:MAG: iron-sulfur cluster assembly scaffold protein [Rhodothalassiaceae bacterium]
MDPGLTALYNNRILRLATQIPFTERLADPDVTVSRTSRICGSRLVLDARFEGPRIARLGLEVKACALGQATTALVAPRLIGSVRADIEPVARAFAFMIREGGPVPEPPWDDLGIFLPVRDHPSRHGSVMLIFDAALAAFDARSAATSAASAAP